MNEDEDVRAALGGLLTAEPPMRSTPMDDVRRGRALRMRRQRLWTGGVVAAVVIAVVAAVGLPRLGTGDVVPADRGGTVSERLRISLQSLGFEVTSPPTAASDLPEGALEVVVERDHQRSEVRFLALPDRGLPTTALLIMDPAPTVSVVRTVTVGAVAVTDLVDPRGGGSAAPSLSAEPFRGGATWPRGLSLLTVLPATSCPPGADCPSRSSELPPLLTPSEVARVLLDVGDPFGDAAPTSPRKRLVAAAERLGYTVTAADASKALGAPLPTVDGARTVVALDLSRGPAGVTRIQLNLNLGDPFATASRTIPTLRRGDVSEWDMTRADGSVKLRSATRYVAAGTLTLTAAWADWCRAPGPCPGVLPRDQVPAVSATELIELLLAVGNPNETATPQPAPSPVGPTSGPSTPTPGGSDSPTPDSTPTGVTPTPTSSPAVADTSLPVDDGPVRASMSVDEVTVSPVARAGTLTLAEAVDRCRASGGCAGPVTPLSASHAVYGLVDTQNADQSAAGRPGYVLQWDSALTCVAPAGQPVTGSTPTGSPFPACRDSAGILVIDATTGELLMSGTGG